ncbi:MAG: hypothetical protein HQK96_08055 [Nitrospirae bacterium]|nr:hypothetical protein [Nitrospirota bacterium]
MKYRIELPGQEAKVVENISFEILSKRVTSLGGNIFPVYEKDPLNEIRNEVLKTVKERELCAA